MAALGWLQNLGFAGGGAVAARHGSTASATIVLSVATGDKFRVRLKRVSGNGTATTVSNASGLTIWQIGC